MMVGRIEPVRTLVAVCAFDRPDLVGRMAQSLKAALAASVTPHHVTCHLDPNSTELTMEKVVEWADEVVLMDGIRNLRPRARVSAMRCQAIRHATRAGFERIAFLDSDVLLDPGYFLRLEELWAVPGPWGAVSLGNYEGYSRPPYVLRRLPSVNATLRTLGMGASLAFPLTPELKKAAAEGVPRWAAWDTHFSRVVARPAGGVLTSDVSFVRHLGKYSGLCASTNYGLDFSNPTPALETA